MAPPCFSDLGRQARDIFNKNYHLNLVKLDCKTKSSTGVEFCVNGSSNIDSGKVTASLESKYKIPEYGIIFKEKWNTDNVLNSEVSVEDKLLKGSKLALDTTFVPQTGKKSALLKGVFKGDNFHVNSDILVDPNGPVVNCASVLSLRGWLVGAQSSFDTSKNKLSKCNFAVAYATDDFVLHTNVDDGQEFGGSVYQKVNSNLETGVLLKWSSGNNVTTFGLGCVYSIDKDTSLRAKINNSCQIGLGISHKLRDGIHVTLSAGIDGRNFNQGGHKLGLGLDLEG